MSDDPNDDIIDTIDENTKVQIIYIIYGIAIIFWIFLVIVLELNDKNTLSIIIKFLPLISFFSAIIFARYLSGLVERQIFSTNYLSLGIILIVPIVTIASRDNSPSGKKFTTIAIVALVLSLISFVDYWLPEKYLFIMIHFRSILQTSSIVLFTYALYTYSNLTKYKIEGKF